MFRYDDALNCFYRLFRFSLGRLLCSGEGEGEELGGESEGAPGIFGSRECCAHAPLGGTSSAFNVRKGSKTKPVECLATFLRSFHSSRLINTRCNFTTSSGRFLALWVMGYRACARPLTTNTLCSCCTLAVPQHTPYMIQPHIY